MHSSHNCYNNNHLLKASSYKRDCRLYISINQPFFWILHLDLTHSIQRFLSFLHIRSLSKQPFLNCLFDTSIVEMRTTTATALAATAFVGAVAQSSSQALNAYISIEPSSSSTSSSMSLMPNTTTTGPAYVTTTVSTCNSTPESTVTVSQVTTITMCPECMADATATTHTTVYTTVMGGMCTENGQFITTPTTYTVTKSCTMATPSWTSGSSYVPQCSTVTRYACSTCDTATTMTVIEPCGCEATNGVPASASASAPATSAATPAATTGVAHAAGTPCPASSGGSPPATTVTEPCDECEETPAPSSGSGSGSGSDAGSGSRSGSAAGNATGQGSYGAVPTTVAPSPYSSGAAWGNISNITPFTPFTPFTGAATSVVGGAAAASVLAAFFGLLAFAF